MNNTNNIGEKKAAPFFDKKGKLGTYTVAVSVIVLAVIIVLNLIVSLIPSTFTVFDTTSNNMFTLSDTTKKFVSGIGEEITIYWLCAGGGENSSMRTFLDRYAAISGKIKIRVVDPVTDPNFISKYTDSELSNMSVIVESAKRYRTVDFSSMSYYSNGSITLSAEEYAQYYQYYGAEFLAYYGFEEYFGGDSAVTSAIEYVVAESVPTVYILTGHDELDFSSRVNETCFSDTGIPAKELNISLDDDIPADCTCLVINAPQNDITAGEAKKLTAYVERGGHVLLITDPGCDSFANLASFTRTMGMAAQAGVVSEGDAGKYYSRNPQYIMPTVSETHKSTSVFLSYQSEYKFGLLMPSAHGIATVGAEGVTVTPLMTTTSNATTDQNSAKQSYDLAAVAEKGTGSLLWLGSSQLTGDSFISFSQGGNLYFFVFALSWSCDSFKSTLPEIDAVKMTASMLSVTEGQANVWGNVFAIIVPLAVVALGVVIVVRRRRHA